MMSLKLPDINDSLPIRGDLRIGSQLQIEDVLNSQSLNGRFFVGRTLVGGQGTSVCRPEGHRKPNQ